MTAGATVGGMNADTLERLPSRTSFGVMLRWWRRVTGAALILLGFLLPDPHAFGSSTFELVLFVLGGAFVIASTYTESIVVYLAAVGFSVGACLARASVIVFVTSNGLSPGKIVPGVIVWLVMAGGYALGAVGSAKVR